MVQETEECERYRRQADVVGEDGQAALARARIVIAGVGGPGSSIALYSAAAGIGQVRLIDRDTVEESNLKRQIMYRTGDIGAEKVTAAAEDLRALKPEIEVEPVRTTITAEHAASLVENADLVLDAPDNFPARYALAAWQRGIPFFHGAVHGLYGQATSIIPGRLPCLRGIVPSPPAPGATPIPGATTGGDRVVPGHGGDQVHHEPGNPPHRAGAVLGRDPGGCRDSPGPGRPGQSGVHGSGRMSGDGTVTNGTVGGLTVTVRSFATFREVMDPQLVLQFPKGSTVRTLLADLTARFDGLDGLLFAAPGTLRDFVNILKNGRNIHFLAGLDTPLEDGDLIALFPPLAGG